MLEEHKITGSFGVASFPVHGFSVEDIIRVADAGMYVSKHAGGNRVSTAEEFGDGEMSPRSANCFRATSKASCSGSTPAPSIWKNWSTLRKLCGDGEDCNVHVLRESIEALTVLRNRAS